MSNTVQHHEQFDEVAEEYDAALQKGLSVTGEDKRYFARADSVSQAPASAAGAVGEIDPGLWLRDGQRDAESH